VGREFFGERTQRSDVALEQVLLSAQGAQQFWVRAGRSLLLGGDQGFECGDLQLSGRNVLANRENRLRVGIAVVLDSACRYEAGRWNRRGRLERRINLGRSDRDDDEDFTRQYSTDEDEALTDEAEDTTDEDEDLTDEYDDDVDEDSDDYRDSDDNYSQSDVYAPDTGARRGRARRRASGALCSEGASAGQRTPLSACGPSAPR
jgi:hypothetical protein